MGIGSSAEERKRRFLITGGAGFLGSALANHLAKAGHHVRVLDDLSAGDTSCLHLEAFFERVDGHREERRGAAGDLISDEAIYC